MNIYRSYSHGSGSATADGFEHATADGWTNMGRLLQKATQVENVVLN